MKIAYVFEALGEPGVDAKIAAQLREWAPHVEVRAFATAPAGSACSLPVPLETFTFTSLSSRLLASTRLARAVQQFEPDAVYLRYDIFLPPLWQLARRRPTVVEINSDDLHEFRDRHLATRIANRINRRVLFGAARGIVAVTNELARREVARGFRRDVEVIGNAAATPATGGVAKGDGPARIAFIGHGRPWHGLPHLCAVARHLPSVQFDVIGVSAIVDPPPNLCVHGILRPFEYAGIFREADAGLGPLALGTTGLTEASPLKVRDYLVHGLPVILAHRDPDLSGRGLDFVLQLPRRRDAARDAAEIGAFLRRLDGRRVPAETVDALVGAAQKERRRLEFVGEVVGAAGG